MQTQNVVVLKARTAGLNTAMNNHKCPVCWGDLKEKIKRDKVGRFLVDACDCCSYEQPYRVK